MSYRRRKPEQCPEGFKDRYTVQPGDTMFLIAQEFDVSLNQLIAANPHIQDADVIFPGDVLCVPEEVVEPEPLTSSPPVHFVHERGFQQELTRSSAD